MRLGPVLIRRCMSRKEKTAAVSKRCTGQRERLGHEHHQPNLPHPMQLLQAEKRPLTLSLHFASILSSSAGSDTYPPWLNTTSPSSSTTVPA